MIKMKFIDKIIDYFYDRKIKIKNIVDIKEINMGDYRAAIYAKLPLLKKYCIWSTYNKDINNLFFYDIMCPLSVIKLTNRRKGCHFIIILLS